MEPHAESTPGAPRLAGWLFGALACLYVFVGSGHIVSPDGVVVFRASQALLEARSDIEPLENWPGFGGFWVTSPDGTRRFETKYGLGPALAALPTSLLGQGLAAWVPLSERGVFDTPVGLTGPPDADHPLGQGNPLRLRWDDWTAAAWPRPFVAWTATWTNAWATAAAVALLFLLGCELGFGVRASLAMGAFAGLASPLVVYARTFFSEPLVALALTGFLLLAVRASRRERGHRLWIGAGLALGSCALVKIALGVLLLPGTLLVAALLLRRERWWPGARSERLRSACAFAAGCALPLSAIAAWNLLRFGAIFETGYGREVDQWTTPFLEGLYGLLFSSGRGLVWYAPFVGVAVVAAPRFARRFGLEAAFVGASLLVLLTFYARWYMWEGGWCWGPRFLVPLLPLLLLPVGAALAAAERRPRLRPGLAAAFVVSAVVAWSGTFVDVMDFHNWVKLHHAFHADALVAAGVADYYDLVRWDWRFSPLIAYWRFPIRDAFLLPHALATPGVVLGLLALFFAGAVLCAGQLLRGVRTIPASGADSSLATGSAAPAAR